MAVFLVDDQLPDDLAARLRALGQTAWHVREIGLGGMDDGTIALEADARGAAIITKDADFVQKSQAGGMGSPVVWIRLGNTKNSILWQRLSSQLDQIAAAIEAGERIFELR